MSTATATKSKDCLSPANLEVIRTLCVLTKASSAYFKSMGTPQAEVTRAAFVRASEDYNNARNLDPNPYPSTYARAFDRYMSAGLR